MCAYDNLALRTYFGIDVLCFVLTLSLPIRMLMCIFSTSLWLCTSIFIHVLYTHIAAEPKQKVGEGGEGGRIAPIPCSHPFSGL